MLRNKLLTACSAALLTAALYGCSSSSDDGANMKVQDLEDQFAALSAELGEGEELTPEALAALIQAKADAEAALADAMVAHGEALRLAGEMAEDDKAEALRLANEAAAETLRLANEAAEETLRLANEAAADDKAEALRLAKVDADAALKLVQDELAGIRRDLANEIAEKEAKEASDMAKAVLEAIRLNTPEAFMADSPATVKASSAGVLTATQSGYTMSAAPEEIVGWRGRTLENDGDTTVIYTNIENAAATPIRRLYRSASDTAELAVHYNVLAQLDSDMNKDILWADAKRADEDSATTGTGGGTPKLRSPVVFVDWKVRSLVQVRWRIAASRYRVTTVRLIVPPHGRSLPPTRTARFMARIQPMSPLAGG